MRLRCGPISCSRWCSAWMSRHSRHVEWRNRERHWLEAWRQFTADEALHNYVTVWELRNSLRNQQADACQANFLTNVITLTSPSQNSDLWVERSVNCWTCNTCGHVTKTVRRRKQNLSATSQQDHNDATMSGFFLNTIETNNLNRMQNGTSVVLVTGIDSGAGLGYPIIQDTWSGRVCTLFIGTAPQT